MLPNGFDFELPGDQRGDGSRDWHRFGSWVSFGAIRVDAGGDGRVVRAGRWNRHGKRW